MTRAHQLKLIVGGPASAPATPSTSKRKRSGAPAGPGVVVPLRAIPSRGDLLGEAFVMLSRASDADLAATVAELRGRLS